MTRGEERAEREVVDAEADDDRREHGEQRRRGQLAQRRGGADVDDRAVVGLLLARHDLAVGELAADLLHDDAGGAADGADGERREQERHRAADQQADEHLRVGHVDLRCGSSLKTPLPLRSLSAEPSSLPIVSM